MCAGQKETVRIKTDGESNKVQKRIVRGNLKEIYMKFKLENPDIKIGFAKFAESHTSKYETNE